MTRAYLVLEGTLGARKGYFSGARKGVKGPIGLFLGHSPGTLRVLYGYSPSGFVRCTLYAIGT